MRWIKVILALLILVTAGCENNIVISYNPELLDDIVFLTYEKRDNAGVALCDGEAEDHYTLQFIVTGDQGSPITPDHSLLGRFGDEITKIELLTLDDEVDERVTLGDGEKISFQKNGTAGERQDLSFLIDITKRVGANPAADNTDSRSGGISASEIDLLANNLETALKNGRKLYSGEKSSFPAAPFGVEIATFTGDNVGHGLKLLLTGDYATDHDVIAPYFKRDSNNDKNILNVYDTAIASHRKFYDSIFRLLEVVETKSGNQNIVLLTNGYDEHYYDQKHFPASYPTLESTLTSSRTEEALFTKVKEIGVPFMIGANRTNQQSFGVNYGEEVDQKLKKLACISQGIYFDRYLNTDRCLKGQESQCFEAIDYSKVDTQMVNRMGYAIFGTWQLKIQYNGTGEHVGKVRITYRDGNQESNSKEMIYRIVK